MRKLMWISIGFASACALGAYGRAKILWIWSAAALSAAVLFFIISHFNHKFKLVSAVFLGFFAGSLWFSGFQIFYLSNVEKFDQQTVSTQARVLDYSYETRRGCGVSCQLNIENKPYKAILYLNGNRNLQPGDRINGEFRFRLTTAGAMEGATYHQGKGIFLLGYQKSKNADIIRGETQFRDLPAVLRRQIQDLLNSCFPEDCVGFAKALLLGDSRDLDYQTDTALKISGIRHIAAVSGLHVSILCSVVYLIFGHRKYLTTSIITPALLLFAAVSGFTPSVTRACIMHILIQIAILAEKEYDPGTALATACLIILTVNPLIITSVGFQMSVGCVSGIFLFGEKIKDWLLSHFSICRQKRKGSWFKFTRWICMSVATTLSANIFTIPLQAYYFQTVSLIGILANLLLLPLVTVTFHLLILTSFLGKLWLPLGTWTAFFPSIFIRFIVRAACVLSQFPLSAVYTESPYIVAWLILSYVLFFVILISGRKHMGIAIGCCTFGLCIAVAASWLEPLTHECQVTVLNVGQGQSVIVHTGEKTFLVDCGGDRDRESADLASETLLSRGISRLDGIILTHFDRDHVGGTPHLATRIHSDMVFMPDDFGQEENISDYQDLGDETIVVGDKITLNCGDSNITIFPPAVQKHTNDASLAILFQTDNYAILITGDRTSFGERRLLETYDLPDVDVLIAGHHGSATSTCQELLDAVKPETVMISAGEDNSYGHPSQEVLDRLETWGCEIYRTDLQGTVEYVR